MKKVITYTGILIEKPANMVHNPQISHTIEPAQKIPFHLWGECLRAELQGKAVKDVVLVKKINL